MEKSYEPQSFETRWYAHWEASGCFKPSGVGTPYTILLPPPNVTGTLHMGHAFQHTLQDALIRYHRMRLAPDGQRYDTLWQVGTDHAGIATEMVVGRNLASEGKGETRDSLGRDAFIEKVWEWKQQSGDTIARQMRRLGASGDWSREVFTMDPMPSQAVIEAFVKLYEEGLIYRGQRLVNWDPVLKTAISDLEVVSEEEDGFLWSIRYNVIDPQPGEPDHLVVATTRPETMLGDVAVAVHPEDERYAVLVANKRRLRLPLTEREIPIIADDYVDREFGTGAVKITPAHDFNDYAIGQRHGLPLINIFTPEAKIKSTFFDDFLFARTEGSVLADGPIIGKSASEIIPVKYHGLDRYVARKAMLADLEVAGLLIETKPHKLQVPRGDRSGQVIEPYLTDQWFVKMDALAARGLEVVEGVDGKPGNVKFVPENWINTYRHWMGNPQDWCISRQLWWGHRIPAWYDEQGNVYVARDEEEARRKAAAPTSVGAASGLDHTPVGAASGRDRAGTALPQTAFPQTTLPQLTHDKDVLETWFSSSLWPLSTMGWPDESAMAHRRFKHYLPTDVLVTGFDIIFFWVARMIFMTDHFAPADWPDEKRVPFKDVYITGLVRDKDGQKMSKSKGNVLDPLDLIDGISLDELVAKRTAGLMQPKMAEKIEKATRKDYPDGIPAFGADALRFTLAALATHGRDIKFDLGRAEGYKNFCNKLWNAARFVLMNTEGFAAPVGAASGRDDVGAPSSARSRPEAAPTPIPQTDAERWILRRLAHTELAAAEHFANYRFDLLAQALYEFAWNEYCDWFLELAKTALLGSDAEAAKSTCHTLLFVLESLLRLLHPLTPFVTEEIWHTVAQRLHLKGDTISLQSYPDPHDQTDLLIYFEAEAAQAEFNIEWLKSVVSAIRKMRSENNISPASEVEIIFDDGKDSDRIRTERFQNALKFLTKAKEVRFLKIDEDPPVFSALIAVNELAIRIPLDGLVDRKHEITRVEKEIKRLESEIKKAKAKLANNDFIVNAPGEVIAQEKGRIERFSTELVRLKLQHQRLLR